MPRLKSLQSKTDKSVFDQIDRWFLLAMAAVLVLRVGLWSIPGLNVDMGAWQAWIARLYIEKPWHFYTEAMWTHYTPGSLLILWAYGLIFHGLFTIEFYTQFYAIVIKLFSTGFDIGTTYLIFLIVKKYATKKWAYLASFLYFVNPGVIFNTSVWGQFDGLLTFFIVLAFYLLLERKKLLASFLTIAFCLSLKPQAITFLPLFGIFALYLFSFKKLILGAIASTLLFLGIGALLYPKNTAVELFGLYVQMAKDYPYTSLNAFNLWALIGWWEKDSALFLGVSLKNWGNILYAVATLLLISPLLHNFMRLRKKIVLTPKVTYASLTIAAFTLFLLVSRMHERYLLPVFGFFIITACLSKSRIMLFYYAILAIIHGLNLWYVYYAFNHLDNHLEQNGNALFSFVAEQYKIMSLITCLFALGFYYFYYKRIYATTKN